MTSFNPYYDEDRDYEFNARHDYEREAYGEEARLLDLQSATEYRYQCCECGGDLPVGVLQPEAPARCTVVCSDACADAQATRALAKVEAEEAKREAYFAYGQQGQDAYYAELNGGAYEDADEDGCPF